MAKGEFDNLSGKGKPLKHASSYNPYIDFTTHKLNQVLIENGFAPEWILLEKDIKEEMRRLRKDISLLRHKYNAVLSPSDEAEWKKTVERFKEDCDNLNKNILKFNLTVPSLYKQLVNFQLEKEAQKALNSFSVEMQQAYDNAASKRDAESSHNASSKVAKSDSDSFIGMLLSAFKL
jgi:DnaJ family protein C protein 28